MLAKTREIVPNCAEKCSISKGSDEFDLTKMMQRSNVQLPSNLEGHRLDARRIMLHSDQARFDNSKAVCSNPRHKRENFAVTLQNLWLNELRLALI
jgi:hypothetical protein